MSNTTINTDVCSALRLTITEYHDYLEYNARVGIKALYNDLKGAFINKLRKNLLMCVFEGRSLDTITIQNTITFEGLSLGILDNRIKQLTFNTAMHTSAFQVELVKALNASLKNINTDSLSSVKDSGPIEPVLNNIINQVKQFSHV